MNATNRLPAHSPRTSGQPAREALPVAVWNIASNGWRGIRYDPLAQPGAYLRYAI
ncbi:hypothetical protein P3T24_006548 [Paraburkholderia sp. GAS33]|uniref:hypothetical protein n=1 Tax=Paraburkholderia sp. GAS33 TaxID=3035130 RepID=UPI003D23D2A9